ncbi:hypothetical protein BDV19DRAFT_365067 [Aspergillus venezuelensis]
MRTFPGERYTLHRTFPVRKGEGRSFLSYAPRALTCSFHSGRGRDARGRGIPLACFSGSVSGVSLSRLCHV